MKIKYTAWDSCLQVAIFTSETCPNDDLNRCERDPRKMGYKSNYLLSAPMYHVLGAGVNNGHYSQGARVRRAAMGSGSNTIPT